MRAHVRSVQSGASDGQGVLPGARVVPLPSVAAPPLEEACDRGYDPDEEPDRAKVGEQASEIGGITSFLDNRTLAASS